MATAREERADANAAMLEQRLESMRKRVEHCDIEVAQARVSRDGYKLKLMNLMVAMREQGIEILETPHGAA